MHVSSGTKVRCDARYIVLMNLFRYYLTRKFLSRITYWSCALCQKRQIVTEIANDDVMELRAKFWSQSHACIPSTDLLASLTCKLVHYIDHWKRMDYERQRHRAQMIICMEAIYSRKTNDK